VLFTGLTSLGGSCFAGAGAGVLFTGFTSLGGS
jgi:hypothetical protein